MSVSATAPDGEPAAREFRHANACLGVRNPTLLGYQTGELSSLEPGQLEEILLDVLRSFQPHVVITVGTDGETPDPDRREVHESASSAFFKARQGAAWVVSPRRLYYGTWPRQHYRRALTALSSRGVKTDFVPDSERYAGPESRVTTIIDVKTGLERKLQALRAYSLLPPGLDGESLGDLWGLEYYTRAYPNPWVTGVIERDLFIGVAASKASPAAPGQLAS
jgi:LmbE family N-acetylglucosaminyl deacetylase